MLRQLIKVGTQETLIVIHLQLLLINVLFLYTMFAYGLANKYIYGFDSIFTY